MPLQKEQRSQQRRAILTTLIPVFDYALQRFMDRQRRQQQGAEAGTNSGGRNSPLPQQRRRRRDRPAAASESLPTWTNHHSQYPHHYVRDAAAYLVPRNIDSVAEKAPLKPPKKKNIWLWGFKDYVIDYTDYEVDRQLRLGLPDLTSERKQKRPTERLDGSLLLRSEKFFNYAEQMIADEVEKEIRKYMRRRTDEPSASPIRSISRAEGTPAAPGEEQPAGAAIEGPSLPNVPILKWADLDPAQREFLATALSKRLGRLIAENIGDILIRVDAENGTLWGIGHDDLIQRAIDKNFSLEDVRLDPGPQIYTDHAYADDDIADRPATSYGPFRVQSNSTSSSQRAETKWPTPGALEGGEPVRRLPESLEGSTLAAGQLESSPASSSQTKWPTLSWFKGGSSASTPSRNAVHVEAKPDSPSRKLKRAEPSFGTVFRSLSLRPRKPKEDLKARQRPRTSDNTGRPVQRQRTEDLSLMRSNVLAATSRSYGMMERAPSPQGIACANTSRETTASVEERAGANKVPSTRPLLDRLRRSTSIRRPGSSKGEKRKRSSSPTQLAPVIPTATSSSTGRDLPETVGLGVSYEEMKAATPPVVQNPSVPSRVLPSGEEPPRSASLDTEHVAVAARNKTAQLSPIGEVATPISAKSGPSLEEAAAAAQGTRPALVPRGTRVAAAHDALNIAMSRSYGKSGTQRAPPSPTISQGPDLRCPSGGRLASSATQNPAYASAPSKRNLGSKLLDKLDAERKQGVVQATNVEQIHPALRPAPGSLQRSSPPSPSVYSTPGLSPDGVQAPLPPKPTSTASQGHVKDSSGSPHTPQQDTQNDDEPPKWTWPKNIPTGQAGVPTPDSKDGVERQKEREKKKDSGGWPVGGASGGWSFGNL